MFAELISEVIRSRDNFQHAVKWCRQCLSTISPRASAHGLDRRVAVNLHAHSDNRPGLNKYGRDHFGIASGVQELIDDKEGNQRDGCCTEKSHGITSSMSKKICDQIAGSYRRHLLFQKIRLFPKNSTVTRCIRGVNFR
jgi:hypothetical protein